MKRIIRKLLKLAVLLVAVFAVAGLLYRWSGHRAFQNSITELRGKGEKLTYQELSTPVSTNAAECLAAITNSGPAIALPAGKGVVDGVNLVPFAEAGRARVA